MCFGWIDSTTKKKGGKTWAYEYKYRRGGKTLCALYARENCLGVMIIFGKDERAKFEAERGNYSEKVQMIYDEANIAPNNSLYHGHSGAQF